MTTPELLEKAKPGDTPLHCRECGEAMFIDGNGVSYHGEPDDVDHDTDAEHVAVSDEGVGL